ncbi:aromatic-ring hydroxylase C-terminal domain-containing protein [Streptomyces kutzneri]|uniref:aromatic-ring hydroxylase C-terminal domain-containing protein n=1 Tax=Streptomyces kutzneri TaxID=3051179 RepID=UPI0028D6E533|nr:hypothetical protein [Streptomyces sp. DSM 40907]
MTGIVQGPDAVHVTAQGPDGVRQFTARLGPVRLLLGEAGRAHGERGAGWTHAVRTVSATAARPLPWDAALVRPDGCIAWAPDGGSPAGALGHWFGEPRQA